MLALLALQGVCFTIADEVPENLSGPASQRPDKYMYLTVPPDPDDLGGRVAPAAVRRGELIVKFKSGPGRLAAQNALVLPGATVRSLGGREAPRANRALALPAGASVFDTLALVTLAPDADLRTALEELRRRADVAWVEPNYRLQITQASGEPGMPNDFDFSQLWGLHNVGQADGVQGADIGTVAAWQVSTGSKEVVVAVLDTGVDYYHPDLESNVWLNPGEVPGNGIDDDQNGYVDDVHGFDFVSRDGDPMDDHGHGTHVAGTVGAVGNNAIGITGVCWEVSLMALKPFDETGNGEVSTAVEAIRYAIENGARIINASWGNNERSRALEEVIREVHEAGLLFIAAAGNDNSDNLFYPAAYEHAIGVAATDAKDRRSRFSDYGTYVDLAAPGENIYSTLPNNAYGFFSGTSMATPHVAGVAALVLSRHPEFTNLQVETILRNAVDLIESEKYIGTGRLNALAAVRVKAPLPEVRLQLPEKIYGDIDIAGKATGAEFLSYSLEYGRGTNPTNWTAFYSSATPVVGGTLFQNFSTPGLGEGTFTFRLTAENAAGERAIERAFVQISNVHISSPNHNDILRAGERVPIRGTVFGESRTYRLEHGEGPDPKTWSVAGMELVSGGTAQVRDGVLAYWDTSAVVPDRFYTLKLVAMAADGTTTEFITRLVYLDSHLRPGWPQYLPIVGIYPPEDWRDIAVADLDQDGFDEIVLVDHGNSDGRPARLLVYGHDGSLRWSKELDPGQPYSDIPVAGDIDDDGFLEVFVDVGSDGRLFAFRHDGSPLSGQWPVRLDAGGLGKVLADLDGDGRKELIGYSQETVTRGSAELRQLVVYDFEGHLVRRWEVPACDSGVDTVRMLPAVGNLDDAPDLEIAAVYGCETLAVYKLENAFGPLWTAITQGTLVASPVIADPDANGTNEVIVSAFDIGGGKRGGVHAFGVDGKLLPGWPVLVEESFSVAPALGDLDGDGALEISLPSWKSGLIHLLRRDGFEVPGWPVGQVNNSSLKSSTVLGDVDGDGSPDVVMSSPGFMGLVQSNGDLSQAGGIKAWSVTGRPISLTRSPLPGSLVMESSGGTWHKAAPPVLADIDGNGKLDIIAASVQDRTYMPPAERSTRKNRSSLYVWELNSPFSPERAPWPAFQKNAQRTGYSPAPERVNQPPVLAKIPDQVVAPGSGFFQIELDQYVEDPDNAPRQMAWSVSGNGELVVTISEKRVAIVQPPGPGWTGKESIRFVARDPAGAEAEASVAFEVRLGYVAPTAGPDVVQTLEDSAVDLDVLANDADAEQGSLSVASLSKPGLGTAALMPDGTVRYVPDPDANGTDTFTYLLVNGRGGMALGVVTVNILPVQDLPIANADNVVIDEDTPAELQFLANDLDPDGDTLQVIEVGEPMNGTVSAVAADTWRYMPRKDFYGTDEFTYVVSDGQGGTSQGTVSVIVKPVNDLPVAENQEFTLNRNAWQDMTFLASDPDDTNFTFDVVDSPKHGTLWNYPQVATYYPTNGFSGTDSLTYRANDGKDNGPLATIKFTILDANNPPDVEDASLVTKVGQPAEVHLAATDLDEDPLTYSIEDRPQHGTLTGTGTNYVYSPEPGFLGQDRFTYKAWDGTDFSRAATFNIKVTDQNSAPSAKDFTVRTLVNTPTNITLQATDPESNPLNFHLVTRPKNGKLTGKGEVLVYSPNANFVGSDRFTFMSDDGEFESNVGTVTVAIDTANHPAESADQHVVVLRDIPTTIDLDVQDLDGDALQCPILKGPKNGRLHGLGTQFTYTPKAGFLGSDSFTYKAWDGQTYSKDGKVTLEVATVLPEERIKIESVEVLAEGEVQLVLAAGKSDADVWVSTDLLDWTLLARVPASQESRTVIDPDAAAYPHRFYIARPAKQP
ncbi:MAG: Ig-like domain-containing protein [Verrucomicrobiia bacterium]